MFHKEGKTHICNNFSIFFHREIKVKSVHGIDNFMNCGGAGAIIDNSPPKGDIGLVGLMARSLSIGSFKQRPRASTGSSRAQRLRQRNIAFSVGGKPKPYP